MGKPYFRHPLKSEHHQYMSVIQKIRDKYARIAVIAIALALLGFILMDAFAGRGSVLGSNDTTLGKINGKKIEYDQFNRRVADISKRQGQNGENATEQIVNGLWQQEVNDVVMGEQYKKLIEVWKGVLEEESYGLHFMY